jgi:Mycobacterium membrane protein
VAQGDSDGGGCSFVADCVVKAEMIAHEVDTSAVCPLKAA